MFNQTSFMKLTKVLSLIAVMAVAFSCSKDDDAKPKLEEVSVSLAGQQQVIDVPQALLTSEDEHADMVVQALAEVNAMSNSLALFTPPPGAVKSSEIIVPANGRVAATQGEAVVYIWTDAASGQSIAYQIRDQSSKYTFELFYQNTNDGKWFRMLYAEELKDRSKGYMEYFLDADTVVARWDWTRSGDIFTYSVIAFEFKYTVEYNKKTKAGTINSYFKYDTEYELDYKLTWSGDGHGTWESYTDGVKTESGSW